MNYGYGFHEVFRMFFAPILSHPDVPSKPVTMPVPDQKLLAQRTYNSRDGPM